jgi:YHS domain-containing protein
MPGAPCVMLVKEIRPMEKDVVCGMQVDPAKAAGTSQYNGKTYYFCSGGCKTKFDANPSQFVK